MGGEVMIFKWLFNWWKNNHHHAWIRTYNDDAVIDYYKGDGVRYEYKCQQCGKIESVDDYGPRVYSDYQRILDKKHHKMMNEYMRPKTICK